MKSTEEFPDYQEFAEQKILAHLFNGDNYSAQRSAIFFGIPISDIKKKYSKELVIARLKRPC